MLVSLWWLAKSGCQYQLSPGFANWVTPNSWEILGRQGVPVAAGCSESPVNVNIYSTNCVTWFESWRVSGWWWLRVVVWVWGSEWGRASGGRPESVRVSVSGQEAARRGGGTVHSTQYTCTVLQYWAVNLSQVRTEKLTQAQLWQKYQHWGTEAPPLPQIQSQEVRCRDGKMLCGVWKSDLCFLCIARPYPEKYLRVFSCIIPR